MAPTPPEPVEPAPAPSVEPLEPALPAPVEPAKPWYTSTAVWGGIIAALSGVGAAYGLTLSTEDAAELANALAAVGAGIGGILAVVGRVKATRQIK